MSSTSLQRIQPSSSTQARQHIQYIVESTNKCLQTIQRFTYRIASPQARAFSFLSLPPELRIQIYQTCMDLQENTEDSLISDPTVVYSTALASYFSAYEYARKTNFDAHLYFPLLSTCHTVRTEAMDIFDQHNQTFPSISLLCAFLNSIGRARRSQLQRLSFVYHLTTDYDKPVDRATVANTWKCFSLIANDCRKLQSLRVYVNVQYLAWFSGLCCSHGSSWHGNCNHLCFNPLITTWIEDVPGMCALRALRGIDEVGFEPATGSIEFSKGMRSTFDIIAQEMMEPKTK